jgi:hypothetical protein
LFKNRTIHNSKVEELKSNNNMSYQLFVLWTLKSKDIISKLINK